MKTQEMKLKIKLCHGGKSDGTSYVTRRKLSSRIYAQIHVYKLSDTPVSK